MLADLEAQILMFENKIAMLSQEIERLSYVMCARNAQFYRLNSVV